ncbi:hypothetical protein KC19_9G174900 [Ceratodon purpureus]|uniref:Uncharacterized protein n=1 Tax=Ceratodon purpureus TaxID=3225 RepID=A0A8T0H150_CERPU|nr:hypothetical protein KC19_9G174600 [Ceratodon purpureus]KAG0562832.1 hypothetical protein KC19_9G174900 [Ceratodon purpureus]
MDSALINARAIRRSSDARALGDLGAFVNSEHSSVPCFYSCKINPSTALTSHEPLDFNVSVVRRRNLAIESECHNLDKSRAIFRIGAVNFLEAIRRLVSCRTLTDVQFSLSIYGDVWLRDWVPPGFLDLMSEGFTLLRSSPSLSCFHFTNSLTDASRYCKHLQTLVYENPRLETLTVHAGGRNVVVLAEAIAVCLSPNTVLKSFTLRISTPMKSLNRESLEILFRPLTSSSPSEANANLKELALYFQYPDRYCVDALANLVCRNTTLKKLDLRFSKFRSSLKDRKLSWREFGRGLEVNQTLEELSYPCEVAALRELLVPFVPDRYGRRPNTTLSTLCLFVSEEVYGGVLRDLAVALQLNTTLKHVQFEFKSVEYGNYEVRDDVKHITDKNLWQEEYRIQEILRMMINNELRVNTSLESLTVRHWTLLRVGTESQTSYRGPCLSE